MEELLHENPRKRLIKQLIQGKKFATQLQNLLQQPIEHHGSVSADELVLKIWRSFSRAITELNTLGNYKSLVQIEEIDQPDSGDRVKDSSSEMKKEKQGGKDGRGCYKRRKTTDSWMRESATMNDGCAWRKYGQKNILNSKYPRCYFRCTHKCDEDCRATKQVQIVQENPIIYHTTYFGNHTCNSAKHNMITNNSKLNHTMLESHHPFEVKPKIPSTVTQEEDNVSSTMDSNLWQDFMPPDSPLGSSYFERVISSGMEDFVKFGDFEAIELF